MLCICSRNTLHNTFIYNLLSKQSSVGCRSSPGQHWSWTETLQLLLTPTRSSATAELPPSRSTAARASLTRASITNKQTKINNNKHMLQAVVSVRKLRTCPSSALLTSRLGRDVTGADFPALLGNAVQGFPPVRVFLTVSKEVQAGCRNSEFNIHHPKSVLSLCLIDPLHFIFIIFHTANRGSLDLIK